jgi:hypothetical protein
LSVVGKKVPNPRRAAGKAERIVALVVYVRAPEGKNGDEKCIYAGARGFFSGVPNVQMREIVALAEETPRSKDPCNHYVLSWREGEQPAPAQVEEAVTILLRELGLEKHQAIYGLHADTHNLHLHIVVNRVDPETLKCVEINRGFDIEALLSAVARIEHAQGWQCERNGRYVVLPDGQVARATAEREQCKQPNQQRRDMENRTGEKSAVRVAAEDAGDIFRTAASWQELHLRLEAVDMRYQRTGSGAVIFVSDVAMKASSVDRAASLAKLEKRLGTFELGNGDQRVFFNHTSESDAGDGRPPASDHLRKLSECRLATANGKQRTRVLQIDARAGRRGTTSVRREPVAHIRASERVTSRPLLPGLPGWTEYTAQQKKHYAERDGARLEIRRQQDTERNAMRERHRAARDALLTSREWRGKGVSLISLRSVMAAEQAAEKARLLERHAAERRQLGKQFAPFPGLEEWLRKHQSPAVAEVWRYRNDLPQEISGDDAGEESATPVATDIRAFRPQVKGKQVEYVRRDGLDDLLFGRRASFVDHGHTIRVHDWRDERSALAALQLAAQKWGSFSVRGNAEYKALCVRLAGQHRLRIKNPELQEAITRARERIARERADIRTSERQQLFEKYAAAVQADRYRVMSVRTWSDGRRQTVILGGRADGLTVEEIGRRAQQIDGLSELQYMPLSDRQHHIVISGMTREQVRRFLNDGFQPAVLLESGPNVFGAVINVTEHGSDSEVANQLAVGLNRRYGDPAHAAGVQSHCAPDMSADSERSTAGVRLRYAANRVCPKTDAFMRGLVARAVQRELPAGPSLPVATSAEAYRVHRADLMARRPGGVIDASRIDAAIAVRLRITGHSRDDIERVLTICRYGDEERDLSAYSRRTADFAFGAVGNREVARLSRYRELWLELEGRLDEPASLPSSTPGDTGSSGMTNDIEPMGNSTARRHGPR